MANECTSLPMSLGKPMPQVALGTWQSSRGEVGDAIKVAIEAGYRHIDTARDYLNEGEIGDALEEVFKDGKVTREDLFITTKLSGACAFPDQVKKQTENSLRLLKTGYIDLLLIHFPVVLSDIDLTEDSIAAFYPSEDSGKAIPANTEPIETYKEMEKLVDAGLVKALGLSNFNKDQIQKIWDEARIKPSNLQCECHAWLQQNELTDFCKEKEMTFSAYSPLGSAGRPDADNSESKVLLKDPAVTEMAGRLNKTPAQVLLKYLVQRGLIVLPKSVNKERIISNFQLFDFTLSDEDMTLLQGINRDERLLNFAFLGLEDHPQFPWKI